MNRRKLLWSIGLAPFVTPSLFQRARAAGQDDDDEQLGPNEVEYLFVQTARTVAMKDGVLRLGGVSPATIYFSDRPKRLAGHIDTDAFVNHWGVGEDSFQSDPPNGALSVSAGDRPQEIVLTLKAPKLDSGDLIYDVDILEGAKAVSGGACSLFIDPIGRPMSSRSFAGHHRRVRRRTRRRVRRRNWP